MFFLKMDTRESSNSFYLNIFYVLITVSIFATLKLWLYDTALTYDQRLNDYDDSNDTIKKVKSKRYLPWKQFSNTINFATKDQNIRYILVWTSKKNKPFNRMGYGYEIFSNKFCPYSNCFITDDVNYFKEETDFDAIMFGAEVAKLTQNLLPEKRLP